LFYSISSMFCIFCPQAPAVSYNSWSLSGIVVSTTKGSIPILGCCPVFAKNGDMLVVSET
jgi:hypothetical protein